MLLESSFAKTLSMMYLKKRIRKERKRQKNEIASGLKLKIWAGKNYMELWSTVFYEDILDIFRKLGYRIEVEERPGAIVDRITKFYW